MNRSGFLLFCSLVFAAVPSVAKEFNSTLPLKVFVRGSGEVPDRVIGFTPFKPGHSIRVPEKELWYVRPSGDLGGIQLQELAKLLKSQNVPGLDLSDHWELSDVSLRHLHPAVGLRFLDLSRTRISDAGIGELSVFQQLMVLALPENITNHGLGGVAGLSNLIELSLDQAHISDSGLSALTSLSKIQSLDLSSTAVTDHGVGLLAHFVHLRRLVLGSLATEACAPHLGKLKNLEEIDIAQTQIGPKGLAALGRLGKLKTIYLNRQVSDAGLAQLSASRSLRALDLTHAGITNEGVKQVSKIKTLEELALSQTEVDNRCLEFLSHLPELRMLELSDTHVTSQGLAPLAHLKKLEVLSLSWQTLTREDLQNMAKLKQLKTIVLNGVPLPEATMVQLKRLGSPSPWEPVAGLERARIHEIKKQPDLVALSAPVSMNELNLASRIKPEISRPAIALSGRPEPSITPGREMPAPHITPISAPQGITAQAPIAPEKTALRPSAQASTLTPNPLPVGDRAHLNSYSAPSPGSLREGAEGRVRVSKALASVSKPTLIAELPSRAPESAATGEDRLLKAIALQSNPAHSGSFSGLSAMRQVRQTETMASLNTITSATPRAAIPVEEDKPENSLGEISVGVGRLH